MRMSQSIKETPVYDGDVHLTVSPDELVPYLDEPYKSRIKNSVFDHPFPSSGWSPWMGGKVEDYMTEFTDAEAVEKYSKEFHVDYPIVNTFEPLSRMPEKELAVSLMTAYNDLLFDKVLDRNENLLGLASLATQKPAQAAEEIDRIANEEQIIGGYIGSTAAFPPLGDPEYDIMYQAAEDNDFTIAYHGSVADLMIGFPRHYLGFDKLVQAHSVGHMWSQSETLTSLILNGVPEKFPELNFVMLESGISWVPYMMWRLNEEYGIRRNEAPLLEKTPEEYIRESFYFTTQPLAEPNNSQQLEHIFEIMGADMLMFSSDYPHWDFDNLDSVDTLLQQLLTNEEREKILKKTPKEAFNIE
jgi:predicted TIM-barrel fold metal-dependent hydrolase